MRILSTFVLTAAVLIGTVATGGAAEAKSSRTVTVSTSSSGQQCTVVRKAGKVVSKSCSAKMKSRNPGPLWLGFNGWSPR